MPKKVLLVDDSATILMMERMILARLPLDLITAMNGEDAIVAALTEHPDLILLDVVMPRMGGVEACRRLREDETTRTTPIIMVTTRGEIENVETAYTAGCTDYITKPINSAELLGKVRALLGEDGVQP
jgi:DNA-binding response OmpR family regulator